MRIQRTSNISVTSPRKFLRALRKLVIIGVLCSTALVVTQDIQIFPGAFDSLTARTLSDKWERDESSIPSGVIRRELKTADGETLELWRISPGEVAHKKQVALFFHGNGDTLASAYPYLTWLSGLGFTTYTIDYRGYGYSTGWPSQQGLEVDAEALLHHVEKEEQVTREEITVIGVSLGSYPASYLAKGQGLRGVVLLAPFSSLRDLVELHPFFTYLSGFLWHELPVSKNLASSGAQCILVVHGEQDWTIPFEMGERTAKVNPRTTFLPLAERGHNNLLDSAERIGGAMTECLGEASREMEQR